LLTYYELHGENSAVWVMDWLQMEHAFVTSLYGVVRHSHYFVACSCNTHVQIAKFICLQLDDNLVRMKMALQLIMDS